MNQFELKFLSKISSKARPEILQRGKALVGDFYHFRQSVTGAYCADIDGSYTYHLKIDIEDQWVECTCPYHMTGKICKHLVAFCLHIMQSEALSIKPLKTKKNLSFNQSVLQQIEAIEKERVRYEMHKNNSSSSSGSENWTPVFGVDFHSGEGEFWISQNERLIAGPQFFSKSPEGENEHSLLRAFFSLEKSKRPFEFIWKLLLNKNPILNGQRGEVLELESKLAKLRFEIVKKKEDHFVLNGVVEVEGQRLTSRNVSSQLEVFSYDKKYLLLDHKIYPLDFPRDLKADLNLFTQEFEFTSKQWWELAESYEYLDSLIDMPVELKPRQRDFEIVAKVLCTHERMHHFSLQLAFDLIHSSNDRLNHLNVPYARALDLQQVAYGNEGRNEKWQANPLELKKYLKDFQDCFYSQLDKNPTLAIGRSSREQGLVQKGYFELNVLDWQKQLDSLLKNLHESFEFIGLQSVLPMLEREAIFKIQLSSGLDWFDLKGEVQFGQESFSISQLAELTRGVESNDGKIALADGSRGLIPLSLRNVLKMVQTFATIHSSGETVRFKNWHLPLVEELFPTQDKALEKIKQNLFKTLKQKEVPKLIKAELRSYQVAGYQWLEQLKLWGSGGILADDMGLGKTLQIITLLCSVYKNTRVKSPTLIVMPTSLMYNWEKEVEKFSPHLKTCSFHTQSKKKWLAAKSFPPRHLVFTTYKMMQNEVAFLEKQNFVYVILDESQNIKNSHTKTHLAALRLQGEHRIAMTGTPIENHLKDLWAQFQFVNPGLLGKEKEFEKNFNSEINKGDTTALDRLAKMIAPFYLRRTKEAVLKSLAPKEEHVLYVEMENAQKKLYNKTRDQFKKELLEKVEEQGIGKSKIKILEALLRLRQIACAPQLFIPDSKVRSAKLDLLVEKLKSDVIENHKALVFSQFTTLLKLLEIRLQDEGIDYAYLDGSTRARETAIRSFVEGNQKRIFLISLKAGGVGLNLTAADYVFHLDPWWNPAVENQATDRAHRMGQEKTVMSFKLIAVGTVEEKILELQKQKKELAQSVIQSDQGVIKNLSPEILESIFS